MGAAESILATVTRTARKRLGGMRPVRRPLVQYQGRPLDYIGEVLQAEVWETQAEICRLLYQPPYRVLARACHKVGKSWLAAALINYHYDCYDPSLTITTAPTKEAVKDQLWREVRIMRTRVGRTGFTGPTAPQLWSSVDHWAKGYTTSKGESFQGRHQEHVLYIIDEGVGVQAWVYDVIRSMFKPDGKHHLLVIGNPTDTASQMYAEEFAEDADGSPGYHVVQMSAMDHPNLAAELRGETPPFPAAVSLAQWEDWLAVWCEPIPADEALATDICWPPERRDDERRLPGGVVRDDALPPQHGITDRGPGFRETERDCRNAGEAETADREDKLAGGALRANRAGPEATARPEPLGCVSRWYRPGPEMEARGLGRWPSAGTWGVWSDAAWIAATKPKEFRPRLDVLPVIGCDVARYGDDFTAIHVRHGGTSLHHERHNGWSEVRTAARLLEMANEYAAWLNEVRQRHSPTMAPALAKSIPMNVDDAPVGGGVVDLVRAQGYFVRPVIAQQNAVRPDMYPNARSELWFNTAALAKRGMIDLSPLKAADLRRMRTQAMAPTWEPNASGQRCVEEKAKTKDRLGIGSPDDLDALNLAYYQGAATTPTVISEPSRGVQPQAEGGWTKRGWFGSEKRE